MEDKPMNVSASLLPLPSKRPSIRPDIAIKVVTPEDMFAILQHLEYSKWSRPTWPRTLQILKRAQNHLWDATDNISETIRQVKGIIRTSQEIEGNH